MNSSRFNQYRIMWVMVYFDLPTDSKEERKSYAKFRKGLLLDGFNMMQYSVYSRHCSSKENAEVHKSRIKRIIPEKGNVIIFEITDAQFARMEFYEGYKRKSKNPEIKVVELF